VIVLFQLSGKSPKTGKAFSFPIAEVWRFRDEQVVEMTIHYYDTDLLMNVDSSA
jgi:ketosteroid isomerase-like protein